MKTAEQWVKDQSSIKGVLGNLTVEIARDIQADALHHVLQQALDLNDGHEWPISRIIKRQIDELESQ